MGDITSVCNCFHDEKTALDDEEAQASSLDINQLCLTFPFSQKMRNA